MVTGEIGNVTYDIISSIGADEITFNIPVKNTSTGTIYVQTRLYDASDSKLETEPDTYKSIAAGQTVNITLSSKGKFWNIEDIEGQRAIFRLYGASSAAKALLNQFTFLDGIYYNVAAYTEEVVIIPTGEIGNVTYDIISSIGADEITFNIPVKNTSTGTIYVQTRLYDASDSKLETEPDTYKSIAAGQTVNITLSSKGKFWNIEDIEGQRAIFRLYGASSAAKALLNQFTFLDGIYYNVAAYTECIPNWIIGDWGICDKTGNQTRSVIDTNNCNITKDKPINIQTCEYLEEKEDNNIEYLDIYVKPHSWYTGGYAAATSKILEKVVDISGKIVNYMSAITGYEFIGVELKTNTNTDIIILRISFMKLNITSMALPALLIPAMILIVASAIFAVGVIVGTSEGGLTEEEIIKTIDEVTNEMENNCNERYPNRINDKIEMQLYVECVGTISVTKIAIDGEIVNENVDEEIDEINNNIDEIIRQIQDDEISLSDVDDKIKEDITDIADEIVEELEKEAEKQDECAFEIAGKCLISTEQAAWIKYGAIGVGAAFVIGTLKK